MSLAAQAGVANNLSGVTNEMHSAKHAKLYHVCFFISMNNLKSIVCKMVFMSWLTISLFQEGKTCEA